MDNEIQESVVLRDVPYGEAQVKRINEFPLLRDNFQALQLDFERVYSDVLNVSFPVPEDHASNIKGDLLLAFCHGAQVAIDTNSKLRKYFKLPKELETKEQKSSLILS